MWKKIQERIFPFLIATSALSVSASAAFYSVSGLSKLFAGATLAVIIMAGSLEVAKLVIASLLYQYRKTLPILLKIYLTVACAVLVGITSMGIYGFLSAAYQETANKAGAIEAQIALVETKRDNIKEQLAVYNEEKSSINEAVADLRAGLSNNVIQYKDRETGEIITTTSSSTRRALEKQLDQAVQRQEEINTKVDTLNTQLFNYETEIVEIQTGNDLAGELGPLKYISGLTGIPMDRVINYLLMTIIFVFDPLAISLVIAANFAFARLTNKKEEDMKLFGWFKKKEKPVEPETKLMSPIDLDPNPNDLPDLGEEELPEDFGFRGEIEEDEDLEEYEPNKALKQTSESYKEKIQEKLDQSINKLDVDLDGRVTRKDLKAAELKLMEPNLPSYKRDYWQNIVNQLRKKLKEEEDNTITYN